MKLLQLENVSEQDISQLRKLAAQLPELTAEIDAVLAARGFGQLKLHTLTLTHDPIISLSSRTPNPAGAGITADGLYISSASFE